MSHSHKPVLLGIDGQPLSKSFQPLDPDSDAVVSEDGKKVTMKRPHLPKINKEVFQAFVNGKINPNHVQSLIVHENPLILHLVQLVSDSIDAICTKHNAIGINRQQAKDMAMEVASAVYYLLQSQLEYDKAQAAIMAHNQKKEQENAVPSQESGSGKV